MRKGVTKSGFEFEIDEEEINDIEFIELIAAAEKDLAQFPAVLDRLLGEEQKKRLYDHVRDEKGHVPWQKVEAEVQEIEEIAGKDVKN